MVTVSTESAAASSSSLTSLIKVSYECTFNPLTAIDLGHLVYLPSVLLRFSSPCLFHPGLASQVTAARGPEAADKRAGQQPRDP